MKIYQLTSIGQNIAKTPTSEPSVAMNILYWLKRHGGRATSDQLKTFVTDGSQMQMAMNKLIRAKAVVVV